MLSRIGKIRASEYDLLAAGALRLQGAIHEDLGQAAIAFLELVAIESGGKGNDGALLNCKPGPREDHHVAGQGNCAAPGLVAEDGPVVKVRIGKVTMTDGELANPGAQFGDLEELQVLSPTTIVAVERTILRALIPISHSKDRPTDGRSSPPNLRSEPAQSIGKPHVIVIAPIRLGQQLQVVALPEGEAGGGVIRTQHHARMSHAFIVPSHGPLHFLALCRAALSCNLFKRSVVNLNIATHRIACVRTRPHVHHGVGVLDNLVALRSRTHLQGCSRVEYKAGGESRFIGPVPVVTQPGLMKSILNTQEYRRIGIPGTDHYIDVLPVPFMVVPPVVVRVEVVVLDHRDRIV